MNSYYHCQSSMRKWGGRWTDYKDVHDFMDHTKAHVAEMKHRSLLHNSWGIYLVERIFGSTIEVPGEYTVKEVPTRLIVERHIIEDLGFIPTVADYLSNMKPQPWMAGAGRRSLDAQPNRVIPMPTYEEVAERFMHDDA